MNSNTAFNSNLPQLELTWQGKFTMQLDFNAIVATEIPDIPKAIPESKAPVPTAIPNGSHRNGSITSAIKQLACSIDRPASHLSDTELVSLILSCSLETAEALLEKGDLKYLGNATSAEFEKINGIGTAKASALEAAFELGKRMARCHAERVKITAPCDVADLLMSRLRYLQKEVVVVLALDTKGGVTAEGKQGEIAEELQWGKLIGESQIFEGTLNASVFHPREIFRFAIEQSANSVILAHNHPSGDAKPSQEDIRATKQLIEAGNQIGIKVLDHVIIGDGVFVSLKEENFI